MRGLVKRFVDRTTMYRLVLYYLLVLLAAAIAYGALGIMPYAPQDLLFTAAMLCIYAWVSNEFFAWLLGAVTNMESSLITALILALILPPIAASDTSGAVALAAIAAWAMGSKYIFAWGKKHLFNPAALAVVLSAFLLGMPATWWVGGTYALLPFVVLGGLLVVWKLRRWDLVLAFIIATLLFEGGSLTSTAGLQSALVHSPLFFLAFVMLTEPLTMPPTRTLRIIYSVIIAFFFVPTTHLGSFYFTPELALLIGNAFAFLTSPKHRYALTLLERRKLANGIYEFVFRSERPVRFRAGQYFEWTLGNVSFDSRGNRRYFTIASAPQEKHIIRLGVRFYEAPSAFKRALAKLPVGGTIYASGLAGDFTLPSNEKRKLAFIAGGIGVTPFASMARHFISSGERRDATLLYSSRTAQEVAYRDVFVHAQEQGLRTVYALTDEASPLPGARSGMINATFIQKEIPDYKNRLFYLSGPPGMVDAMKKTLRDLGVSRFSVKTDYFPGLA